MAKDEDYVAGRRVERIYASKEFESSPLGGRPARYISRVFEEGERDQFVEVKGETVLRVSPSGRQQVKAFVYIESREIVRLTFQKFSVGTEKPHKEFSISLQGEEISRLLDLASYAQHFLSSDPSKQRIDESNLERFAVSPEAARALAKTDLELVIQLAESEVTQRDVVALAYRKSQLEIFRRMLEEPNFFDEEKARLNLPRNESVWQNFFELNPWIFGYGLYYVFSSEVGQKKLEQVVAGYSVAGAGKRVDALLRTRGLVSALCFVEVKTHKTPLLEGSAYRKEVWAASRELTGAIAQIQKTVLSAENAIGRKLEGRDPDGTPTGELSYLLRPRSVVVVGSLAEFRSEHGVNDEKYTSFEMLRRSVVCPEIITYDELYERARFIAESADGEAEFQSVEDYEPF